MDVGGASLNMSDDWRHDQRQAKSSWDDRGVSGGLGKGMQRCDASDI